MTLDFFVYSLGDVNIVDDQNKFGISSCYGDIVPVEIVQFEAPRRRNFGFSGS